MLVPPRRRILGYVVGFILPVAALLGVTGSGAAAVRTPAPDSTTTARVATVSDAIRFVDDSLRGASGRMLAHLVVAAAGNRALPAFTQLFGDSAVSHAGVYHVAAGSLARPFAFIALHSFAEKQGGQLGGYKIGFWPGERGEVRSSAYRNPVGFIEVTPANVDTRISEHFRLRDFLTHDQADAWPKYLVLRLELVDKLELVIDELARSGVAVRHMSVMSGFRTPQYNAGGGNTSGRAAMSRHMYGDASDVFVDNDGDGRMDDLNHDGRIDYRDAQVVIDAAARVERVHPELMGGGGVYKATSEHGPFAHIDVRGNAARWGMGK